MEHEIALMSFIAVAAVSGLLCGQWMFGGV